MTRTRILGLTATALLFGLGTAVGLGACGSDGATGANGATGLTGVPGPAGPSGSSGATGAAGAPAPSATSGACTTPCHTFGGVVDQWKFSNHSHPQENEIGVGPCGNCHGIDGIQQRLAGVFISDPDAGAPTNVTHGHTEYKDSKGALAEISYGGATTVGQIHCATCHDFNPTTDPHVTGKYLAGQAPIRVPGGTSDFVMLEKTEPDGGPPTEVTGQSLSYGLGNTCIFCHKSRKDVSFYIGVKNPISSNHWGPHDGPQTDIFSGKGGYPFAGQTYGTSTHVTLANACVSCHMPPAAGNGNVPDHSMKPTVAVCKTCHTQYAGQTFDIQGGESIVIDALTELQGALNNAGLLTRSATAPYAALQPDELADHQFQDDLSRPGSGPAGANMVLDADTAGALYNYMIVARGAAFGVHNPTYTKQLLWDSIKKITGANPTSLPARPQ
jgi:hypothetical protein